MCTRARRYGRVGRCGFGGQGVTPRWHDRHFIIRKYKAWFGILLMLA
jgi:hypothetical protein